MLTLKQGNYYLAHCEGLDSLLQGELAAEISFHSPRLECHVLSFCGRSLQTPGMREAILKGPQIYFSPFKRACSHRELEEEWSGSKGGEQMLLQ